jgi:hypothetical protein
VNVATFYTEASSQASAVSWLTACSNVRGLCSAPVPCRRGAFVFGNEIDFVTKIQQVAGKLRKMHVLCVFSNKTLIFS